MLRSAVAVAGLALVATAAGAGNLETSVALECGSKAVFKQVNTFADMSQVDEARIAKSAQATLELARKLQNKSGPCSILWQWGNQAAVETPGLTLKSVNQVMRKGTAWLGSIVEDSERAERAGKRGPWGK